MKRIQIVGLCLVAAFVMCAAAASSAMAEEPSVRVCYKDTGGKFTEKKCSKEASGKTKGKYELGTLANATKLTFTGKSKKATLYSEVDGTIVGTVTASTDSTVGHYGPCPKWVTEHFKGKPVWCDFSVTKFLKAESSGKKCNSAGFTNGTIETKKLISVFVFVKKVPWVLIFAENDTSNAYSGSLAEFACGEESINTVGSVLAEVTPTGSFTKKPIETLAVDKSTGVQSATSNESEEGAVENVLIAKIEGVGEFDSGQEDTVDLTGEEQEIYP
jgi:hypothetical protein